MYKTVNDFLEFSKKNNIVEEYKNSHIYNIDYKTEYIYQDYIKKNKTELNNFNKKNIKDPKIWGPIYWFNLHNSSNYYPINPSKKLKNITKNRILSIPHELPCNKCKIHAIEYINSRMCELDTIVDSKDNLFKFYVDFHNKVNIRTGKNPISYEEARNIWN